MVLERPNQGYLYIIWLSFVVNNSVRLQGTWEELKEKQLQKLDKSFEQAAETYSKMALELQKYQFNGKTGDQIIEALYQTLGEVVYEVFKTTLNDSSQSIVKSDGSVLRKSHELLPIIDALFGHASLGLTVKSRSLQRSPLVNYLYPETPDNLNKIRLQARNTKKRTDQSDCCSTKAFTATMPFELGYVS